MFKTCLISFILFACYHSRAQNLIANPGFERYNNCPQDRGEILFSPTYSNFLTADAWVSALSNTTPDYYNVCATNPLVDVPFNTYNGFQEPRNGNAYAGIAVISGLPNNPEKSDYREYIETRLSQPLVAGKKYFLNFYVNESFHIPEVSNQMVIDKIGARFTDTQLNVTYPWGQPELVIEGIPDIFNPVNTFLSDTATWNSVNGVYTAHGGEQWLTIGYFKDGLPITSTMLYTVGPNPDNVFSICYMYVDDVCVTEIEEPTYQTIYTNSFSVDISAVLQNGDHKWNTGETSVTIRVAEPGTYSVVTTGDCLYRTDVITVICNVDSATSTSTINTTTLPVTIKSSLPEGEYAWSNRGTKVSMAIYTPGTYWVEAFYNCQYHVDTFNVICDRDTVRNDETIYAPSLPIQLVAIPEGDSLRWNNNYTTRTLNITTPGIFSVMVWEGCRTYISSTEVVNLKGCLWLPSAFTPNGDGKNDNYGPVDVCKTGLPFYQFKIFNRFGECVFEGDDINDRWDGHYKGQLADIGTYYYMLRYSVKSSNNDKDIVLQKGDVTLLR